MQWQLFYSDYWLLYIVTDTVVHYCVFWIANSGSSWSSEYDLKLSEVVSRRSNAISVVAWVLQEEGISLMTDCPRMTLTCEHWIDAEFRAHDKDTYEDVEVKLNGLVCTTMKRDSSIELRPLRGDWVGLKSRPGCSGKEETAYKYLQELTLSHTNKITR
jgi:hypothetical protein